GGRCNVTHYRVDADAYAGSTRNAIRKVLRRFDVPQTVAFFEELGVVLKREETGKLFPVTDDARTVLDALLGAVERLPNVTIRHPRRVETVERAPEGFRVTGDWGSVAAGALVLATVVRSLPKSGSDGHGDALARRPGHDVTPRIFPALVPLTLPLAHRVCGRSGVRLSATFTLLSGKGKKLV